MEKIRRWVSEKKRTDRKENVVLKGVRMPEDIEKDKDKRIEGERINKKKAKDRL